MFVEGDIRDIELLRSIFSSHDISAVVHFAGLKAVGESVAKPLEYYDNNVYGDPTSVPIRGDFPTGGTTNPYGTSKYMVELILADLCAADSEWSAIVLRYFNPAGAQSAAWTK